MSDLCPVCEQPCRPRENNSLGVEVQEYSPKTGWTGATEPYPTFCLAGQAMEAMPQDGTRRRTYSALAPRSTQ